MNAQPHILVIKHGALGDIIIATAGFKAIREAFPDAHITLLTTKGYASLLAQSPYFDEIWIDRKPKFFDRAGKRALKTMLRSRPWAFVFDLQTSQRSTYYQWLFAKPHPPISNISRFASHGYTDKARHGRHALDNLQRQLALAGLNAGLPDISWLDEAIDSVQPASPYALLVPGGAAHRPGKRWPAEQYAALAHEFTRRGITPVLIGTQAEGDVLQAIADRVARAVNLSGKTSIAQLAALGRQAAFGVGNDTGPMHVIAATGCPSTVIFSHESDPVRSAPAGAAVTVLRERDLSQLSVDRVLVSLPG
jgi:ADP-heptose:LPS heptosyltransferase